MLKRIAALLLVLLTVTCAAAAEGMISASVQVKASRSVYDSVIRTGEDVDMTVQLRGFAPAACLWYHNDVLLEGESLTTLHIDSAEVCDTGLYRMDALDGQGRVRVSVDVALRVVDHTIPKTGDSRVPAQMILPPMAAAAVVFVAASMKKAPAKR